MDIMKQVDIMDLITIEATVDRYGHLFIDFVSLDQTKRVVMDESVSRKIEDFVTSKTLGKSKGDTKILDYVKEYAGKMASESYKNGLLVLEDIPDEPEDPYAKHRKLGIN
jgi:hypothetical protein